MWRTKIIFTEHGECLFLERVWEDIHNFGMRGESDRNILRSL